MASITLSESGKLSQDMLIRGVIESVVTVNPIFEMFPFMEIDGNALSYNQENALGDVQLGTVGTQISAKAAASFTQQTASLTTILGDAEINGLIEATRSNMQDQRAIQIASKAKSIARAYQQYMITGTGASEQFKGINKWITDTASGQLVYGAAAGATATVGTLTLDSLDALIDLIKDKDGQVDYMLMNSRTKRSYYALLRGLGGASIAEVVTLPSGRQVPAYRGVPIFTNDYIPVNETVIGGAGGTTTLGTTCTSVYAGTFDDGSGMHGISGLTARGSAGIRVENVGLKADYDESIIRIKFYCGMALFSTLGVGRLAGITN
jgi:HK97 family phage major capsid protein